jgi:hypothetical protein
MKGDKIEKGYEAWLCTHCDHSDTTHAHDTMLELASTINIDSILVVVTHYRRPLVEIKRCCHLPVAILGPEPHNNERSPRELLEGEI